MKADKHGDWAEALRYAIGWRPGNQHPRCELCATLDAVVTHEGINARCSKHAVTTQLGACCNDYQPAKLPDAAL